MNSEILDRYEMTSDNRFIIDVKIPGPDELFEKYDENSSFYKKDLDARFETYLLECVEEIGLKNNFTIRIALPEDREDTTDEGELIFSFKQYFNYCILTCQKTIKTISFRMLLHVGLSTAALLLAMVFNAADADAATGFFSMAASGLSTAVWVLLLTGFSRFLFRLMTQRSEIKMFRALKNTPVDFVYNGKQGMDGIEYKRRGA